MAKIKRKSRTKRKNNRKVSRVNRKTKRKTRKMKGGAERQDPEITEQQRLALLAEWERRERRQGHTGPSQIGVEMRTVSRAPAAGPPEADRQKSDEMFINEVERHVKYIQRVVDGLQSTIEGRKIEIINLSK
jgi:hypothetical protein